MAGSRPRDAGQLTEAAIAAYDEPEGFDAGAAVLVAVGQLLDAGLLTSDEPVIARREDVAWVDSGDRIVALPLSPGPDEQLAQPAALTGSAALIWEWLEEPVTHDAADARARPRRRGWMPRPRWPARSRRSSPS